MSRHKHIWVFPTYSRDYTRCLVCKCERLAWGKGMYTYYANGVMRSGVGKAPPCKKQDVRAKKRGKKRS